MAIDFGRMARGITTGYLDAKIRNTEANDKLKEGILKQRGENFYNVTLPEFQKKEANRKDTYNQLSSLYNRDVAEYMDQEGLITGEQGDLKFIVDMLKADGSYNEARLKSYLEAKKAGTYSERAEKRFTSIKDQEDFIMNNMTKSGFGVNTIRNQLGFGEKKEEAMAPTAPTAIAPVPPTADTDTTTTKLPSFQQIFGTEPGVDKTYISLDREDKTALRTRALAEFNSLYQDELTGETKVTPAVKASYNSLPKEQKDATSLEQYAFDNFFRNEYLPSEGYTYKKTLPADIVTAKRLINEARTIGDDAKVKLIKNRLINAGYDITDYNL